MNPLALTGPGYALQIAPEAETIKAACLKTASAIVAVSDPATADLASTAIKECAAFRFALEKSRKAVKQPVLDLGKSIDARAEEFGSAVQAEEKRLSSLVSAYAAEQERKRREEEARLRREAELARMKAEQEAAAKERAEREARQAEERRIAAERAAAEATSAKAKAEAELAARIAKEEADARIIEAEEAERKEWDAFLAAQDKAAETVSVAAPPSAKATLDFEVTDIAALYATHPHLCTLAPSRSAILAELKRQQQAEARPVLPGIRVIETFKIATR